MAKPSSIVPLGSANLRSRSIAYGRHGAVQVFAGCDDAYSEAMEGFERILSFEPRTTFMLIDCGDSWEYVRCPATEPTPQGNQYVIPGCEKDQTRGPAQMALW